jgi:hypothetical protein
MERILARVCIFNCSMAWRPMVITAAVRNLFPLEKGLRPEWLINACGSFTHVLLRLHEAPWAFTLIEMSNCARYRGLDCRRVVIAHTVSILEVEVETATHPLRGNRLS